MKVFCKEFITVWTRELVSWLSRKFDSISIDLTPVEEKLDEVKGDVADVKMAVENIHIDTSDLAKETSVKDGNDTAIGMLKDNTNGLAAIKSAIPSVASIQSGLATSSALSSVATDASSAASDAAAAKTAAQAITGYALQGSDQTTSITDIRNILQNVLDRAHIDIDYSGLIFEQGHEPESVFELAINDYKAYIVEIHDTNETTWPAMDASNYPLLKEFESYANRLGNNWMKGSSSLEVVKIPYFAGTDNTYYQFIYNMSNIKILDISQCALTAYNYRLIENTPNLIDLLYGAAVNSNTTFIQLWSPTNALLSSSNVLVTDSKDEFDNPITNNLEQLLYNIRRHIAANLPDRTGLSSFTITFSAAVKAAILADAATLTAFTNKNWTIA